jgi:hypothetical protein
MSGAGVPCCSPSHRKYDSKVALCGHQCLLSPWAGAWMPGGRRLTGALHPEYSTPAWRPSCVAVHTAARGAPTHLHIDNHTNRNTTTASRSLSPPLPHHYYHHPAAATTAAAAPPPPPPPQRPSLSGGSASAAREASSVLSSTSSRSWSRSCGGWATTCGVAAAGEMPRSTACGQNSKAWCAFLLWLALLYPSAAGQATSERSSVRCAALTDGTHSLFLHRWCRHLVCVVVCSCACVAARVADGACCVSSRVWVFALSEELGWFSAYRVVRWTLPGPNAHRTSRLRRR